MEKKLFVSATENTEKVIGQEETANNLFECRGCWGLRRAYGQSLSNYSNLFVWLKPLRDDDSKMA